jgi:hypothetical protein
MVLGFAILYTLHPEHKISPASHGPQAGDVGKLVIFAHVLTGCRVTVAASAWIESLGFRI